MKRTLVTTVLTTLGLGLAIQAQPGPRWAAGDDATDDLRGPGRQGPPPWAMRGGPGMNGPGMNGPRWAQIDTDQQPDREAAIPDRQGPPRRGVRGGQNGMDRQGPPPWVTRGGQFGAGRQGPPPWVNRGQAGQGPRAFAGPANARGQMMRQMLRTRLQNAQARGRVMQHGVCPLCGRERGQGTAIQRGFGAGRPGPGAQPGLQAGPRNPRGQMGLGAGRGPQARMGRESAPAEPEVNAPQRRGQEQPDRPSRELRGQQGPRGLRDQAPDRAGRPTPPEREAAE